MESLRGKLLLASPALMDPNFRRAVVLVGEHNEEGALGLVLNRPSPVTVAEAVPQLEDALESEQPVFVGGPVQPETIVVLAEFDDPDEAGLHVGGGVGFPPPDADLASLGEGTVRSRVFAGYAGWGPGQLEDEVEGGDWILEQAEPEDVFGEDSEELWRLVLERKGGRFALLARMPLDPSLN